jgi:gliding motility-associated-like protein
VDPGDVGATYVATVPGTESSPNNSSPQWNQLPPLYVCANLPMVIDQSAFDVDGDSLVYSLCTPLGGASATAPAPNPPSDPPYLEIPWQAPYGLGDLLGGPVPLTIDAVTGEINAIPDAQGTFVIGMCVQEYRNGILLGETTRAIQLNVVNCQAPVAIPDDVNEISPNSFINCTEFVEFNAFNSAGFDIWWDFGDPTTLADTANTQITQWQYPGPGSYDLTLVVYNPINPNDPLCTDTVIQEIIIQDTVIPVAGADTATCPGIPVQIGAEPIVGWTYDWDPPIGLDDPNIAQPTATITGEVTYVLTATDAEGCSGSDSITISLLENTLADAGPDVQLCSGDSVQLNASGGVGYLWSPNLFITDNAISNPFVFPPSTADYIVEVTNSDGCIGTDTVNIELFEPALVMSNDTSLCIGDTIIISAAGAVSYSWSPNLNISDTGIGNPEVWPTSTTTYLVDAVDVNTCDVSDSITVTVVPLPTVNAGSDLSTCFGETTDLLATGATGYVWEPVGSLSDPNISNPTASPSVTTMYLVTGSDVIGCSNTDTVMVSVNDLPTVDAGADTVSCNGVAIQLNATGGVDYSWSPVDGLNDPLISNPIALPAIPTEYVVTATDANSCSNTDTVFVDVFSVDAVGDTIICIGDTAQIGAIGGATWSWNPIAGLSDPNAQFPTANPATTTVYTITADDGNGCLATDTVTVVVSPLPDAFAGFDQGVCAGSSAQLNATGGVTYAWSPTDGLSDAGISNPAVTFSSDTITYVVTVTDIVGCVNTDSVTVWQEPLPDAVVGPDTTICFGESVQLFAGGGETYIWDPAAGLNNPTIQNPIATPLATTTYTVTVGQLTGNLVFNGDFSQGNVGFGSDYDYATQLNPEGLYSVVTNANSVHNNFQGIGHTGNAPVDSFMVVNGAGAPNQNVWCQTVSVTPNTDYYFGAWVSTVALPSPALLQFSINGQVLGTPFTAPFNINNWTQFFETWNSGTATTATICVVNQNTITGGNDFALDDITFSTFCTNTAEVLVTVNQLPEANAGGDQSICVGDVTQMDGSGGATYQWVPPIGLDDPTSPTTDADPIATTVYTLIVQDNIGCLDTDIMTMTVNPLPPASAGSDHEVCIGESVILQGSGGLDYSWSPGTFLDDENLQLPESTPEQTISYTVTVTDGNSCVNIDSVTVVVNPLPTIDAGLDSMICANSTIVLQASGGDTYLWSPLIGLSDPQSATPTASPLTPIVYTVVGTDINGCVNSDSVNITIFTVTAGPDSIICLNDSVQAFVSGGASFNWTPTEGVSDPTSGSPFLSPETSTSFTVTVTSEFGCESSADVSIDILTLPVAQFAVGFEPGCDGIHADFENNSENSEAFYWTYGDGNSSTEFEPSHMHPPGSGYVVTLIAYNNDSLCVDSLEIDYSEQWFGNDTIEIEYGNVFTPNFDGLNDCFRPGFDGRFSECYQLTVYNRWGALIFESTGGQNHCWDGHTKAGKLCEEGTFYYISRLNNYERHGYVTLIH